MSLEFPNEEDVNVMFGNVPTLHALSDQLVAQLAPRLGQFPAIPNWSPHQKIGDVFVQIGPYFKVYGEYCRMFETASAKLLECRAGYPAFAMLLDNLREVHKLDCGSFLIMPIQRIPRYKMLLEEITKATRPEHRDYADLCKAASLVGAVAKGVNSYITEMESKDYIIQLATEVENVPFELVTASRTFVREATLEIKFSGSEESSPYRVILFNDCIIYFSRSAESESKTTSVTHNYEGSLPLARGARVKRLPMMKNWAHGFALVCNNRSYTLACRSRDELEQWVAAIEQKLAAMQRSAGGGSWEGAWVDVQGTEDRTAANSSKTYTVYKIEVQLAESMPRKTIYKRYSEFHKLDQGIRASPANRGARFPELPPKHMIKMFRTQVRCCWLPSAAAVCCCLLLPSTAAVCCCRLLLPSAAAVCCCCLLLPSAAAVCCCRLLLPSTAAVYYCRRRRCCCCCCCCCCCRLLLLLLCKSRPLCLSV
eukprot:SAG22_NODE_1953_length_3264_cov_3.629068_2_plen_481_part_00